MHMAQRALQRRFGVRVMKEIQKSEYAIARLPLGVAFEGFDLEIEDFMITVYWGGCHELERANIDFPKIEDEGYTEHGLDFRHVTSEQILKEKPDGVNIVTVIYNDFMQGAVLQYGNYSEKCWVMLGRLNGFA